jgi:hypothetical protein
MASNTDPEESGSVNAPGLEPGGGVTPGDTPPDTGQTAGLSHPQPIPSRVGPVVALTAVAITVLAIVCFFLARVLSLV